jgi:hypothetical protein
MCERVWRDLGIAIEFELIDGIESQHRARPGRTASRSATNGTIDLIGRRGRSSRSPE